MGALYNQWQVLKLLRFLSQCGRRSGRNGKRKVLPATFELNQVFAVMACSLTGHALFPGGTCSVALQDMRSLSFLLLHSLISIIESQ